MAAVDSTADEVQALVVATRPLKTFVNETQFFATEGGTIDMNVNAASSGATETLYDEDTEWAAANVISNDFDFNDSVGPAGGPYSGSVCIDATGTSNNDTMELNNIADFDLTAYSLLTGWIYITGWSSSGTKAVNITAYDGGSPIGLTVDIGDYVNTGVTGWQNFVIPLVDMALVGQTITALRIATVDIGAGQPPNYWLDLIEFTQPAGNGQQDYRVRPTTGEWIYVYKTHWTLVVADSATVDGSNNMNPYDTLLGQTLGVGIIYQRVVDGEVIFSVPLKQLSDFIQLPGAKIKDFGGDGTNTWMTLEFSTVEPLILKWKTADYIRLLVNDDMSNFLLLRAGITGKIESRPAHD